MGGKAPARIISELNKDDGRTERSFGKDDNCTICLDTLRDPLKLPCGHWYCKECIDGLRQSKSVQDSCPVCREPLPPGAQQFFEQAWKKCCQVERQVERRGEGWSDLPPELQAEMQEICRLYGKAADEDHTISLYNLGVMYSLGKGVERNDEKAFEHYLRAANQGDADAQYNIGVLFENGRGVKQDSTKAIIFWEKAAAQGLPSACYNLGMLYMREGAAGRYQAIECFQRAAARGHVKAQCNLLNLLPHEEGFRGNGGYEGETRGNWTMWIDHESSGLPYFINNATNETQWEVPATWDSQSSYYQY